LIYNGFGPLAPTLCRLASSDFQFATSFFNQPGDSACQQRPFSMLQKPFSTLLNDSLAQAIS
jgi:hypothetical protein